eukprot:EG_transcript_11887
MSHVVTVAVTMCCGDGVMETAPWSREKANAMAWPWPAHMALKLAWLGAVLDPLGIRWWAQPHSGTLLGIYRHRGQVPFLDSDADVEVEGRHASRALAALHNASQRPGCPYAVAPYHVTRGSDGSLKNRYVRVALGSPPVSRRCLWYNRT